MDATRRSLTSLLTLLVALGSAPTLAGWTEATVAGTLNDVQIWGPGTFTVSTTEGAFHFVDGVQQGSAYVPGADVAGAFWDLNGCLTTIIGPTGAMSSTCTPGLALTPGVVRVRHVEQGGEGYLVHNNAGADVGVTYYPQGTSPDTAGSASTIDNLYAPLWPMDVVKPVAHSFPFGVFQVQSGGTSTTALLMAEGGSSLTFTPHVLTGGALPGAPIRELELLVRDTATDAIAHVFLAAPNGLYRVDTSPIGIAWQPHVRVFEAPPGTTIEGLGLSEDLQAATQGHGMLLIREGSRSVLRRAVPAFRGTTPGTDWRELSPAPPAPLAGMTPQLISCEGAHTCVVGHSGGGQTHLAIYRNEGGPAPVLTPSAATVGEGTGVVFTLSGLEDPDGDPLGVRWRIRHGAQEVPAAISADHSRATVDTTDFRVCGGPEPLNVQLEVSDGLRSHEVPLEQSVMVTRTRQPRIEPGAGGLEAGVPLELEVLPDDFAVCQPTAYAWEVTGPATLSHATGTTTTLTSDGPACAPEGAKVIVEASAQGTGGWVSAAPATFQVPAWGRAPEPFSATVIEQHAGTSRTYSAQPHTCSDSAGFPGQRTRWTAVGAIPEGVTLSDEDGARMDSSAGTFEAGSLRVDAETCALGTLAFDVVSEVEGIPSTAAEARLRLEVIRFTPPIAEADLTLSLHRFEGGVVTGRLDTDVSCPDGEGWRAVLVVLRDGLPVTDPVRVSPEGAFELHVPTLCAGGHFTLQATLEDPEGAKGVTRHAPFEATPAPARVGTLVDSEVIAACGAGARGELTLQPPAGACFGAEWTWTQLGGPPLTEAVLHGRSIRVQSADVSDLTALIGSTLRFEVIAEAEGIEPDTQVVELTIGSEILVDVVARAETALIRDDTFVGAQLEVRNLTSCPLSGVEVHGLLNGASPVGDRVSIAEVSRELSWEAPRLEVPDVSLGAEGEAFVELLLNPSLLGPDDILFTGEAYLNGIRISRSAPAISPPKESTGCGCNGSGSGGWVLPTILAGLFLSFRGRR